MGMTRAERLAHRKRLAESFLEEGAGEQLDMWEDGGAVVPVSERAGPGRPAGSSNKLKSKLRDYMAGQGYRDPAVHLAMMAGLDRPDMHPLAYAAQIAGQLGEDVMDVAKVMRQAAADVLPYYHAKITPDVSVNMPVMQVHMAPQGSAGGPSERRAGPPPMPTASIANGQQNQQVTDAEGDAE